MAKVYNIYRKHWWRFWQIDVLEFSLPTRYCDAYKEVERKTINGHSYTMELCDWVKDDIREQLSTMIVNHNKLVKKSKKLKVSFYTDMGYASLDTMCFYIIDKGIYFDSDDAIKRERLLNKLGI